MNSRQINLIKSGFPIVLKPKDLYYKYYAVCSVLEVRTNCAHVYYYTDPVKNQQEASTGVKTLYFYCHKERRFKLICTTLNENPWGTVVFLIIGDVPEGLQRGSILFYGKQVPNGGLISMCPYVNDTSDYLKAVEFGPFIDRELPSNI